MDSVEKKHQEWRESPWAKDAFLHLLYQAAIAFGEDMIRAGYTGNVDEVYDFLDWVYQASGVAVPRREEFWNAVNASYDTTSKKLEPL